LHTRSGPIGACGRWTCHMVPAFPWSSEVSRPISNHHFAWSCVINTPWFVRKQRLTRIYFTTTYIHPTVCTCTCGSASCAFIEKQLSTIIQTKFRVTSSGENQRQTHHASRCSRGRIRSLLPESPYWQRFCL